MHGCPHHCCKYAGPYTFLPCFFIIIEQGRGFVNDFSKQKDRTSPPANRKLPVLLYAFTAEADGFPSCMQKNARKNAEKNRQIEMPAFLTLISYRKTKADDFHSILDSLRYVKDTCFFVILCISKPLQLLPPLFKQSILAKTAVRIARAWQIYTGKRNFRKMLTIQRMCLSAVTDHPA